MRKLMIAALAALFAASSSAAIFVTSAQQLGAPATGLFSAAAQPALADRDDNDEHEGSDHHDNGKHKGWYKHGHHGDNDDQGENEGNRHHHSNRLVGRITAISGNQVMVQLRDGRIITVNDQYALDTGRAGNLFVGETVRLSGRYGNNGVFYATAISGTSGSGNVYAGSCNSQYATQTVTGFVTSGLDGNGNFTLKTDVAGIPLGTSYRVHVSNSTCYNGVANPGNIQINGQRLRVTGVMNGDGSITATNIQSA